MPKKQTEIEQHPQKASSSPPSDRSPMGKRLAITFGLAQLIWLLFLAWVAWEVLSV